MAIIIKPPKPGSKDRRPQVIVDGRRIPQRPRPTPAPRTGRGPTGGTRIIVDARTGKSIIVPESTRVQRTTSKQEFQQRLFREQLKRQGFSNVGIDKSGNVIGTKGSIKTIISRQGKRSTIPISATFDVQRAAQLQKKVKKTRARRAKAKIKIDKKKLLASQLLISGVERGRRVIAAGRKDQRTALQRAQQKFTAIPIKRRQEAREIKQFLEAKKRSGIKITANERLALAMAGAGSLGALALRGFGTPFIRPVETAKGIGKLFTTNPVTTVNRFVDAFSRDPIGVTVEMWAASQAFRVIGAGIKKGIINPALKTRIGVSSAAFAGRVASKMKSVARRVPGASKAAALKRAAGRLGKSAKSTLLKNKAIAKATKGFRKGKPQDALARQLIRKIEVNKLRIKSLGKSKVNLKQVNSLKRGITQLNKKLRDTGVKAARRVTLRRAVVRELKGKPGLKLKLTKAQKLATKQRLRLLKGKTTIKTQVKVFLDPKVKAIIKSIVNKPTQKVLSIIKPILQRAGRTIKKLNPAKPIIRLTRATKRKLADFAIRPSAIKLRQLNRFLRKSNLVVRRIGRKGVRKTIRTFKKGRLKLTRTVRKARELQKVRRALTKSRATKIVLNLKQLKLRLVRRVTLKKFILTSPLRKLIIRLKRQLNRTGGKINKSVRNTLRQINRKSPVKFKLQKVSPKKPRVPLRQRPSVKLKRAKRKLSKVEQENAIVRQILRGRRKVTAETPFRIRKKVRKARQRAIAKRKAGIAKAPSRKAIGKVKKQARLERRMVEQILRGERIIRHSTPKNVVAEVARRRKKARTIPTKPIVIDLIQMAKQFKKSQQSFKQVSFGTRQQLRLKSPRPKNQVLINKVKKVVQSKTKTAIRSNANSASTSIRQQQVTLLKLKPRTSGAVRTFINAQLSFVGTLATVLNNTLKRAGLPIMKGKIAAITRAIPKVKPIAKQTQRRKTVQKQEEVQKTVQIPKTEQRIDTLSKTAQLKIITSILVALAAASAFRIRGTRITILQTRLRGGIAKARKFIFNRLQKKRRAFTPDIYSLIFGIKAKRGEKIKLLKPGRVFTGLERRAQVR